MITKRNVLSYITYIYDPLGLISSDCIIGNVIYHELREKKLPWDTEISKILTENIKQWANDIANFLIEIPRSLPIHKKSITSVDLHVFRDASIVVNCAPVYAVVNQPSAVSQCLVASKSRISIRYLTIARIELVSTHMTCNLIPKVKSALRNQNVRSVTGWTDSTVVLYWLKEQGSYNQFARNRVYKILERDDINWQYNPTRDNPADLVSRGSLLRLQTFGWKVLLGYRLKKTDLGNQT